MQGIFFFKRVPDGFIIGNKILINLSILPDDGIACPGCWRCESRDSVRIYLVEPYRTVFGNIYQSVIVEVGEIYWGFRIIPCLTVTYTRSEYDEIQCCISIDGFAPAGTSWKLPDVLYRNTFSKNILTCRSEEVFPITQSSTRLEHLIGESVTINIYEYVLSDTVIFWLGVRGSDIHCTNTNAKAHH